MGMQPIRLGPDNITTIVPGMLGFHPADSLVLVYLSGAHHRVVLTARIDLPARRDAIEAAAATAARADADLVIAVVYSDTTVDVSEAIDSLGRTLPVDRVIRTGNSPTPVDERLAGAMAVSGRAVLGSRRQLAQSVEYQQGVAGAASAEVVANMADSQSRDDYLASHIDDAQLLPDLITAAQDTPDGDPAAADVLAILALAAYRAGDGALARVALDRAFRCNPTHRLALLASHVFDAAITPGELSRMLVSHRPAARRHVGNVSPSDSPALGVGAHAAR